MKEINISLIEIAGYQICKNGNIISYKYKHPRVLRPIIRGKTKHSKVQLWFDGNYEFYYIHRLVATKYLGLKIGQEVDHIDRNPFNNNVSNLRIVTRTENAWNHKAITGVSKYKSVVYEPNRKRPKKWRARITFNGYRKHLGYFETEEQAMMAYNKAALKYHGNYACTDIG